MNIENKNLIVKLVGIIGALCAIICLFTAWFEFSAFGIRETVNVFEVPSFVKEYYQDDYEREKELQEYFGEEDKPDDLINVYNIGTIASILGIVVLLSNAANGIFTAANRKPLLILRITAVLSALLALIVLKNGFISVAEEDSAFLNITAAPYLTVCFSAASALCCGMINSAEKSTVSEHKNMGKKIKSALLDIESAASREKCPECGAVIKPGCAFCSNCGERITKDETFSKRVHTDTDAPSRKESAVPVTARKSPAETKPKIKTTIKPVKDTATPAIDEIDTEYSDAAKVKGFSSAGDL